MMLVSTIQTRHQNISTNARHSFWWHNQFLHLDMYDHQLSSKTKSANPTFLAKDARWQAIDCQREAFAIWRRRRVNTRMR